MRLLWILSMMAMSIIATSTPGACLNQSADFESAAHAIRELIADGRYVDAEVSARELVSTLERTPAGNPEVIERARDVLVQALLANGRGAEGPTRTLAEQAVRVPEAATSPDPARGIRIRSLAQVLFERSEYQSALSRFIDARRIHEQLLGPDAIEVADDLDGEALTLMRLARYDDALASTNRAISIRDRKLPATDVGRARTLEVRGTVLQRRGDYPASRQDLETALSLREAAHPAHPDTATAMSLLGVELWVEGDLPRSHELLERAVALAEVTLRPDHPTIAENLKNLAAVVQDLGDLATARALGERATAICEKAYGPDHPALAAQMSNLALTEMYERDYSRARGLFERAQGIWEREFGPDYVDVIATVYNLALIHANLGDFSEATKLFDRALRSWTRTLGPNHPNVARVLSVHGETLSAEGLDRQAIPLYRRALAIRERTLGPNHVAVARTTSLLAASLSRIGMSQSASELSQRALRIWDAAEAPEPDSFSTALLVDARIEALKGDHAGAKRSYERALDLRLALYGDTHSETADARAGLAVELANMGQTSDALREAITAEESGRLHLQLTLNYLPERQALLYAASRPEALDLTLSLIPQASSTLSGFDLLIRRRALVLDEMASRRRSSPSDELRPYWERLASARQKLANLVLQGPTPATRGRFLDLVDAARAEKERAERALAEQSTPFRSELERSHVGIDQVGTHLPAGSALISYFRYNRSIFSDKGTRESRPQGLPTRTVPSYLAFVLVAGTTEPTLVPLGDAASIDQLVTAWRQAMLARLTSSAIEGQSGPSLRSIGLTLRRRIWDTVGPHLMGAGRVFVVPDGALNLLPLAALPTGQGRYLLEDGPVIHYLSAERDLVVEDRPPQGKEGLLAVGGPAFSDGSSFARLAKPSPDTKVASSSRPAFRSAASNCVEFKSMRFEALPGSRAEVEVVANLWQQLESEVPGGSLSAELLIGSAATEGAFKTLGPAHKYLHFATHGFFLSEECASAPPGTRSVGGLVAVDSAIAPKPPAARAASRRTALPENPLLRSGLALAGANRRSAAGPDEEDGILTAEEVAALNLEGVEWAVLSACDTGLGTVATGEGVLGLRRAFQVAGARTVIMSLWSVEDRATRQWMEALYRARLGQRMDTPDALREASINLIRDRRAKGLSTHPFYWAGFVAAGDWR